MIHIGAIRKIFRGWRILICAWVDDNSPLKSQFFMLFRGDNGKEYIKIGKGYDPKTDTYPRMVVTRWSITQIVTAIIDHDMDFLIHFQRNVIKNCSVEGIDPRVLSAMRDILQVLEAVKEIGVLTELPTKES